MGVGVYFFLKVLLSRGFLFILSADFDKEGLGLCQSVKVRKRGRTKRKVLQNFKIVIKVKEMFIFKVWS